MTARLRRLLISADLCEGASSCSPEVGNSKSLQRHEGCLGFALILCIIPVFIISTNAASENLAARPIPEPSAQWDVQDLGEGSDYDFNEIVFSDASHGWVMGWGVLLSTDDGGVTWDIELETRTLRGLSLVGSTEIWVGGSGRILHTVDGGGSWNTTIGPTTKPTNLAFLNSTHGIAGDVDGLFRTTDGGNTWQDITMVSGHDIPYDFHLTPTTVRVASRLGIFRSDDWGNNWYTEYDGYANALDFLSEEEAWSINGANSYTYFDGNHWTDQEDVHQLGVSSIAYSYDIDFVDSSHGWVAGLSPSIAYTPDGGKTWYEQLDGPSLKSVCFLNETHGWAAGWNGIVARTTTGDLLGPRLYTGIFLQSSFSFGGRLIPYSSLLFGGIVTVVYSIPVTVWIAHGRIKRRGEKDDEPEEYDPFVL